MLSEGDTELIHLKQRNQWIIEKTLYIQFRHQMEVRYGLKDSGFGQRREPIMHCKMANWNYFKII